MEINTTPSQTLRKPVQNPAKQIQMNVKQRRSLLLLLFLSYTPILFPPPSSSSSAAAAPPPPPPPLPSSTSCPIDFTYTSAVPWDYTPCLPSSTNDSSCCQTLLSLLGIGLSLRLISSSLFRLPDQATSAACLSSLQSNLSSSIPSLPSSLVSSCFPSPDRFVASNRSCAGILSRDDWSRRLPNDTRIDRACQPHLSTSACQDCVGASTDVVSDLVRIDGNASNSVNCFYFAVIYAGAINAAGPTDANTVRCVYGLQLLAPPAAHGRRGVRKILLSVGIAVGLVAVVVGASGAYLWWRRREEEGERLRWVPVGSDASGRPNVGPIWYDMRDVKNATGNFSETNLVGRGRFGVVYKGVLPDGTPVAVKRLMETDADDDEVEFRNEITILGSIRHRNLLPLRGCCIGASAERYLVYDYMPNGNLHDRLFKAGAPPLTWPERKAIILDVARALAYLHYGVRPAIFHRDVKSANILLDSDVRARVADFGLARQGGDGESYVTGTNVAGTHGYLAPEYALYGHLTKKSDVYSFGVVVLEVMSGRKALELMDTTGEVMLLRDWAWGLAKVGREGELMEKVLAADARNPTRVMERFILVGMLCAHLMVALRPTMADALKMLEGDIEVPPVFNMPSPLCHNITCTDGHTFNVSPTLSSSVLEDVGGAR